MASKRLLAVLFICLFTFSVMSHNTYALDINQAVEFKQTWTNARMVCAARYGNNITVNGNTCTFGLNQYSNVEGRGLSYIYTSDVNLVQGDYYELFLDVSVSDLAEVAIPVMWNLNTTNNFTIVGFEQVSNNNNLGTQAENEAYVSSYRILLRSSVNNSSYPIELGYSDHSKNFLYIAGSSDFSTNYIVDVRITRINRYSPKTDDEESVVDAINNQTEEQEQATQDAADASNSAGSSAASDSEQATSSLLSTITGFFTAIIGVNPSNCKFNSNLPFLPGNGEIDLCSINTPPIVQTLSSLVLVGLFIPFCIHMFNRFISITESFQR